MSLPTKVVFATLGAAGVALVTCLLFMLGAPEPADAPPAPNSELATAGKTHREPAPAENTNRDEFARVPPPAPVPPRRDKVGPRVSLLPTGRDTLGEAPLPWADGPAAKTPGQTQAPTEETPRQMQTPVEETPEPDEAPVEETPQPDQTPEVDVPPAEDPAPDVPEDMPQDIPLVNPGFEDDAAGWANVRITTHAKYPRPNATGVELGRKFGVTFSNTTGATQQTDAVLQPRMAYTFKASMGAVDESGTITFAIGYLARGKKAGPFTALASKTYRAYHRRKKWTVSEGVTLVTAADMPAVRDGRKLAMRIRGRLGRVGAFWFDNVTLTRAPATETPAEE